MRKKENDKTGECDADIKEKLSSFYAKKEEKRILKMNIMSSIKQNKILSSIYFIFCFFHTIF